MRVDEHIEDNHIVFVSKRMFQCIVEDLNELTWRATEAHGMRQVIELDAQWNGHD